MQGINIASQTLNEIINNSAKQLYDNYIDLKVPIHISKKQVLEMQQLCSQQFVNYNKLEIANSQKQPQQLSRDSMGFKQVALKKKQFIQSMIPIKVNKTQKVNKSINKNYTSQSEKKIRVSFLSMKNKQNSQFIKLQSPDIIIHQEQTIEQKQQRRAKSIQIQKNNAINQQKQIDLQSKMIQFQNLQQQYKKYSKQSIKTTFSFSGVIIPTIKRHTDRSIVSLKSSVFQIPKLKMSNKKISTTRKNYHLTTQNFNNNNIFTSLLHKVRLDSNTECKIHNYLEQKSFNINEQYNNNNQRQMSHSKLIDLKQGINLIQPTNKIYLKNKITKRIFFHQRKSYFKHFTKKNEKTNEQYSSSCLENNDNDQEEDNRQFILQKTHLDAHFSTDYKSNTNNKFNNTQKSYINPWAHRNRSLNRSKTFYNNGNQKINITNDSIDILFN